MADKVTTRTEWIIQWQAKPRGRWQAYMSRRDETTTDLPRMRVQMARAKERIERENPDRPPMRWRLLERTVMTTSTPWRDVDVDDSPEWTI